MNWTPCQNLNHDDCRTLGVPWKLDHISVKLVVAGFQVKDWRREGGDTSKEEGREVAWGHHHHTEAMVAGTRQVALPHGECTVPIMHACKNATSHPLLLLAS